MGELCGKTHDYISHRASIGNGLQKIKKKTFHIPANRTKCSPTSRRQQQKTNKQNKLAQTFHFILSILDVAPDEIEKINLPI